MSFGRLERTPGDQPMSEINVTPLVDVMLVLVVIFILTAPLLASAIRLDLPRAQAAASPAGASHVTLAIDPAGKTFLDDRPVNLEQLSEALRARASAQPETEIHLRADATVPYGRVVEVMGLAQKAGLNRIAFVTQSPER